MKGLWSAGKSITFTEKVRKVLNEVKWRDFEVWRKSNISKNRVWKEVSEVKWMELKWGEDQLNAVKGRELKRGEMWSVYKCSEVEWDVGIGEIWVIGCCRMFYSLFSIPSGFNTDSPTSGSTRFWVLIWYNMCVTDFVVVVILRIDSCLECCTFLCVMCVIVLYCIVLSCIVAHRHRVQTICS
jgi:hypothetical protein